MRGATLRRCGSVAMDEMTEWMVRVLSQPTQLLTQGYLEEVARAMSRAWRTPRRKTMGFFLVMRK